MFFFAPIVCKKEGRWCWGVSSMIPTMSPGCKCPRESQNAALPSGTNIAGQDSPSSPTLFPHNIVLPPHT